MSDVSKAVYAAARSTLPSMERKSMASTGSDLQAHSRPRNLWSLCTAIAVLPVSAALNVYGAMIATRAAALDSFGLLLAILAIVSVIALLRRAKIGRLLGLILGYAMLYRICMTILMLLTDQSNTASSIPA